MKKTSSRLQRPTPAKRKGPRDFREDALIQENGRLKEALGRLLQSYVELRDSEVWNQRVATEDVPVVAEARQLLRDVRA